MNNQKRPLLQRIIGGILALPVLAIAVDSWGYSFGKIPFNFGLSLLAATFICAAIGMLIGGFYKDLDAPYSKNLGLRIALGALGGGLAVWTLGAYLSLRGYPKSLFKFEYVIAVALAVVPSMLLYRFMRKD